MVETIRFCRGNLPHWLVADRTYFVTMRLNGTLPRSVVEYAQKVFSDKSSVDHSIVKEVKANWPHHG